MLLYFRNLYSIVDSGNKPINKVSRSRFVQMLEKVCEKLIISGIDLHGGTRHSTVSALRLHYTPEQIRLSIHVYKWVFQNQRKFIR